MRISLAVLVAWLIAQSSPCQTPVIVQSQVDGAISWTNDVTNVHYRVEWAYSLDGPWHHSWETLSQIYSGTNYALTVSIPMFYRVVALPASEHLSITADPSTILYSDGDSTVLTVTGGTPPYSWSCEPLGEVNPATGYSTVYTRQHFIDNAVTVQDSEGDYAIIVIQQPE